jgi:hypothetical protein
MAFRPIRLRPWTIEADQDDSRGSQSALRLAELKVVGDRRAGKTACAGSIGGTD